QKEVVDRMAAAPNNKSYGRLSVMLSLQCDVEPLFDINPGAFSPPPKVTSSFVRLTPKQKRPEDKLRRELQKIVTAAFSMRRKTLRNSLKTTVGSEILERAEIDSRLRAENLSVADYVRLAEICIQQQGG
ncbi:MAG: rRNA adenine dimethyltransferase family protein, partial [Pseudomonadota bacterium]